MINPYKLIVINLVASFFLLAGLIALRYVYPKRKINAFYLLIFISLLPILSVLRKGTYESGDLSLHAKFAMSFYESLRDGQIIPQWASMLCGGFGCPHFIFLYTLPYYVVSLFHFSGFSFIDSVKSVLIVSYISSGITMYLFVKNLTKNSIAGMTSGVFYLFAPYHLVDMHFRVAIGEMSSFVFVPLFFYFSSKTIEQRQVGWIFGNAATFCMLLLSHQVISSVAIPLTTVYTILFWKVHKSDLSSLYRFLASLVTGVLISSFYWIPLLFEAKYTSFSHIKSLSFEPLISYLYSPWRYGLLFQGPTGHLSYVLGYAHLAVLFLGIIMFARKKIIKKIRGQFLFFLGAFCVLFFFMQPFFKPVLERIPIVSNFQMISRMLVLLMFIISAIAGVISLSLKKKYIYALCIITIGITILNWGNRRMIPQITDYELRNDIVGSANGHELVAPIWIDRSGYWNLKKPKLSLEILKGNARIKEISRTSVTRQYIVLADSPVTLKENTYYFPGWTLRLNNKDIPITYTDNKFPGVIIFRVPKGFYRVDILFLNTKIRRYAKFVSGITLLLLVLTIPLYTRVKYHTRIK